MTARGSVFRRCGCTAIEDGKRVQLGQACPKLKRPNGAWANHGTWAYSVGVTLPNGKRTIKRKAGYATKDEAQSALDSVRDNISKGVVADDKLTVGEYLAEWIGQKTNLKTNTLGHYRRYVQDYFTPNIGHIKLRDLRPAHVHQMFEDIREARGSLGASNAQRMRAVLRSALSDAMRASLVASNAAALTKIDSARPKRALVWTKAREAKWRAEVAQLIEQGHSAQEARRLAARPSSSMVWTGAHLGRFLDTIEHHPLYALFWLTGHCGPRRGEVCALQWADLDEHHTLVIERQLVTTQHGVIEDTTKTEGSQRVISIDAAGTETLQAHRAAQLQRHTAAGLEPPVHMFTQLDGKPYNPNRVTKIFNQLSATADLPPIRFHDLRHTAASLMLAAGLDIKVVSAILGHSDTAITRDIYTSVYEEAYHEAITSVIALVPRAHNEHTLGENEREDSKQTTLDVRKHGAA